METLLNAIWLAITVVLLVTWHTRWLPVRARRRNSPAGRNSFIALVCALVLLFPAISLSDDLHPVLIGLPDTKSSYAVTHSSAPSSPDTLSSTTVHAGAFGLPASPSLLVSLFAVDLLAASAFANLSSGDAGGPDLSRAPPVASLS
jgi:hypothetical protein